MTIGKVWIYRLLFVCFVCVCVCLFVCFVRLRIIPAKTKSVKFCTVIQGRPEQGISHFGELIGRIGHPPGSKVQSGKRSRNRVPVNIARRVDVGSACVDIRPSPKTDVLVLFMLTLNYFKYVYFKLFIMRVQCFTVQLTWQPV